MTRAKHRWGSEIAYRGGGMILLGVAAACTIQLYRLVHMPPVHDASVVELGLAALAFLGASAGSSTLLLGPHIHDRVEVAERWRRAARPVVADPAPPAIPASDGNRRTTQPFRRAEPRGQRRPHPGERMTATGR